MFMSLPARGALAALALMTALAAPDGSDVKKKRAKEPPPPKVEETVSTLAQIVQGDIRVEGVGLVVGLDNTGSDPSPSPYRTKLLNEMRKAGVEHPDRWLAKPGCSLVVVRAVIPHGITTKDPLDVEIELPPASATTNLARGKLLSTELATMLVTANAGTKEGKVMAIAGGPIMTGTPAEPNNPKVGRVLGGGRVKADIPYNIVIKEERRSARTTKLVEDVVKLRFHQSDGLDQKGVATAKTDNLLVLKVPKVYHHNQFRFFQVVLNLALIDTPTLRAQRLEIWGKELLDPKTAGRAALKLEGLGPNAIPTLRAGLASPDPVVKFFSAEALAYVGSTDGATALADAAAKLPDYRIYALKALAAMDDTAGLMKLRALMNHPDVELRYGAFDALRSFDATDPFLGQVRVLDEEKPDDSTRDGMALMLDEAPRRRPRPAREEPFKLYVVDSDGPPLIHVSRNLHSEIVIFGRNQKLMTPIVLGAGGAILINAAVGDDQAQITRITSETIDRPEDRITCPLDVPTIVRRAAKVGASYPEIVTILRAASEQKNLPGPLVVDAIPMPSKAYMEAQVLGTTSTKDDDVKRTKGEAEKKPGLLERFKNRIGR